MVDTSSVIGSAGSGKRELVLVGAAGVVLVLLFGLWRARRSAAAADTSVAGDLGAAGYTYPMPAGGLNTAPADNSALTSLFTQQQEILRLLAPSDAGTVGAPTGTPDAGKDAPAPTQAADVPTVPWYAQDPGPVYTGSYPVGNYTPPAGMPIYTAQDQATNSLLAAHAATGAYSSSYLVGGQMIQVDNNYANSHASDLALATDPYLNPDLRQAAITRLSAA